MSGDDNRDANAQQPLRGVVLCGTSLEQNVRAQLGDHAIEMGATHSLDLTSAVTHLLVGDIETAKYKHVAKCRPDVHVLQPGWIAAVRDAWVEGGDVDVESLTEQFRLPTFYGLNICITGFEDGQERLAIQKLVEQHGGTYHSDLTKNVSHLIVAKPKGAKYDRARQWNIRTVSFIWLQQSVKRGMVLDESLYDPLLPSEEQGQGAVVEQPKKRTSLGKRSLPEDGNTQGDATRRKIRRTASTRLSSQSQDLWADIAQPESIEINDSRDSWADSKERLDSAAGAEDSDQSCNTAASKKLRKSVDSAHQEAQEVPERRGLFSGWTCFAIGHKRRNADLLKKLLEDNGAVFANDMDHLFSISTQSETQTALIVPSMWTSLDSHQLPDLHDQILKVTELWVERCLIRRTLLDPADDALSRPIMHLPPDFLKNLKICSTGLGSDVGHVVKIVNAAGGQYCEVLDRSISLLVCNASSVDLQKAAYARDRKIPTVTIDWLFSSITSGDHQPFEHFKLPIVISNDIPRKRTSQQNSSVEPVSREASPSNRNVKPPAQRLSAVRRKGVTPSLSLARSAPNLARTAEPIRHDPPPRYPKNAIMTNIRPFQDDSPSPPGSPLTVQILDELPPAMNSPQKRSQSAPQPSPKRSSQKRSFVADDDDDSPILVQDSETKENQQVLESAASLPETPTTTMEPPGPSRNLNQTLSDLLERSRSSASRADNTAATANNPRRRKDRKLGRALSGNATISFTRPTRLEIADSVDTEPALSAHGGGGGVASTGHGHDDRPFSTAGELDNPPLPSQQLTYDAPGAEEHRRIMSRNLGTRLEEDQKGRVGRIGTVRDAEESIGLRGGSGVGERVRGRHREGHAR